MVKQQTKFPHVVDTMPAVDMAAATIADTLIAYPNAASTPSATQSPAVQLQEINETATPPTRKAPSNDIGPNLLASTREGGEDLASTVATTSFLKSSDADVSKKDFLGDSVSEAELVDNQALADPALLTQSVGTMTKHKLPLPTDMSHISDPSTAIDTGTAQAQFRPQMKDATKICSNRFTSPMKKVQARPSAIDTDFKAIRYEQIFPSTPVTPVKRALEGTLTPPLDSKRIKTDVPPHTPGFLSRSSSASPGTRSLSVEAQIAEKRKQLAEMHTKRVHMAKQQADIDRRLAPHQQAMAEELERLNQQMADEVAMMAMEEQEYEASEKLLAEFEGNSGQV